MEVAGVSSIRSDPGVIMCKATPIGHDDAICQTVQQILTQVAREDDLLAVGLSRSVASESAHIDSLVRGVREGVRASLKKASIRK